MARSARPTYKLGADALGPMVEEVGRVVNVEHRRCRHCELTRANYVPSIYTREGLDTGPSVPSGYGATRWPTEEIQSCACECHSAWRAFGC